MNQPATRRRPAGPQIVDFDAERKKRKKKAARFQWRAFGRVWSLKRPNVAVVGELEELDTVGAFVNYLLAHVDKADREEFLKALHDDEDLDFDVVAEMAESMQKVVYSDLPTNPS